MAIDHRTLAIALVLALAAGACARAPRPNMPRPSPVREPAAPAMQQLIPLPKQLDLASGAPFAIGASTVIGVTSADPAAARSARELAEWIRRATGLRLGSQASAGNRIDIAIDPARQALGPEGYELTIEAQRLALSAAAPAGLFYGVQTLRQLLPPWAEHEAVLFPQPRTVTLPALRIVDTPRFAWRGAMLDVARHFFAPDDVKRYIDLLALHKMNRLHLHLSDDQGWRIEIRKWPDLTAKGGATEVGGTPGGFYTQEQYKDLVAYAAERFITIVPEIDMPGHTNAALSSYPALNCNRQAPPPFTGTDVGFSSLCVDNEDTYRFIDDVVGEIAALTPGPYFHMGGDEVKTLEPEKYRAFVERVQSIVQKHGREMIGWDEIAAATLLPTTIVQHWRPDAARTELARAPRLILSPANRLYLDMKYDADTALGLRWAALIPVEAAYGWDPATLLPDVPPGRILGIEAALWSETLATIRDVEFMAMPRLAIAAEKAWASPVEQQGWPQFRERLGAQGPRWTAMGINFYRAPGVPWK
ncbi:MAG TPA: beta-N-acetylhexosaminidase [Vicinamibacterales bacterium]|nr:beta-N-acetylhexosaminidase [Vicinamibacterales bacterium]